jgi:AmmeMemoRadiSam system protein B
MPRLAKRGALPPETMDRPLIRPIEAFPVKIKGETMIALHDPQNLATGSICVTPAALFLIQLFDGEHNIADLQNATVEAGGERIPSETIESLIRQLDDGHYLDSPAFESFHERLVAEYRAAPVRPPSHAGASYPDDPEALREELDGHFVAKGGPGEKPPADAGDKTAGIRALIAPHIDFQRGGPCYAWGYHRLARAARSTRFIVLGTCHGPMKRLLALTRKPYATPYGTSCIDTAFVDALAARLGDRYFDDEFAHRGEHSIEFQVVFLQHLYGPDVSVVPLLCGSLDWFISKGRIPSETQEVQTLFGALRELINDDTPTCVIAAADLSHVGPRFGDRKTCSKTFLDLVRRHDLESLACAEAGDAEGFYRTIAMTGNRMRVCGLFPIYALLSLLDGMPGKRLKYDQAVDEDGTQCVSYASLAYPSYIA